MTEAEMRDLLQRAEYALRTAGKKALVVKPLLDVPYPEAPQYTAWSQYLGPAASRAYNLAVEINRALGGEE